MPGRFLGARGTAVEHPHGVAGRWEKAEGNNQGHPVLGLENTAPGEMESTGLGSLLKAAWKQCCMSRH